MSEEHPVYAVIMAGGRGERFWPKSRTRQPKQLLNLIGALTMIEQTVGRLSGFAPSRNIIVITNREHVAAMRALMPELPADNIVGEPVGRDTAPCVALASALVEAKAPPGSEPVMVVSPADHVIHDTESLIRELRDGVELAARGAIVTIGIKPTFPSTGYGYIKCDGRIDADLSTEFFKSGGFREKPDAETAKRFLESGEYRWNSGMFIWSVPVIQQAIRDHAPALAPAMREMRRAAKAGKLDEVVNAVYPDLEKMSIDYAVMEKAEGVIVADCGFDWDDVGSWPAMRNHLPADADNNIVSGLHAGLETTDCVIVGEPGHLVATVGVDNLIIVQTGDATLVCDAGRAQKIKTLVKRLNESPELRRYI